MAFKFEIIKHYGIISEKESGWKKELNLVSYNDKPAKFDIREWDEDHERMAKGITFTKDEILKLRDLLNSIDFNKE